MRRKDEREHGRVGTGVPLAHRGRETQGLGARPCAHAGTGRRTQTAPRKRRMASRQRQTAHRVATGRGRLWKAETQTGASERLTNSSSATGTGDARDGEPKKTRTPGACSLERVVRPRAYRATRTGTRVDSAGGMTGAAGRKG